MKQTGTITKIRGHQRCYDITTDGGESVLLFFEELSGGKFILGDIICFETLLTDQFGMCALNPIKTGNIYFEELKVCLKTKKPIKAYVYNKNEGGYEASYHGYRCFLPNGQCYYNGYVKEAEDLMDGFQNFTVIAIIEREVILSLEETLKSELEQLKIEEVKNLKQGFQFMGEVRSVKGYGLFVNYKYTEGLLHVKNIIEGYDNTMSNVQKNEITKQMKSVFLNDEKILVTVSDVSRGQFSLDWDKRVEPNKTKCQQLREYGIEV